MLAFAEASHCRRQILLRYFDEPSEAACTYCDVCDNPPVTADATIEAQKFLSCIYRLKQNYGLTFVIEILRGSTSDKIKQAGHQSLSTFGIVKIICSLLETASLAAYSPRLLFSRYRTF